SKVDVECGKEQGDSCAVQQHYANGGDEVEQVPAEGELLEHEHGREKYEELNSEVDDCRANGGEREHFTGQINFSDERGIVIDGAGAVDEHFAVESPERESGEDEYGEHRNGASRPEKDSDGEVVDEQEGDGARECP